MSRYVMKRESGVDGAIMWATVLTGAFGVLMVYDSSAVSAALRNRFDSATFFFERQLIWFIVGTAHGFSFPYFPE